MNTAQEKVYASTITLTLSVRKVHVKSGRPEHPVYVPDSLKKLEKKGPELGAPALDDTGMVERNGAAYQ
ncbi:MAG: hypothetical protein KAQ74_03885 [Dehalococcoidia bacterium]|nr:hypothetical protein [Dehalococcoidia bacterium]